MANSVFTKLRITPYLFVLMVLAFSNACCTKENDPGGGGQEKEETKIDFVFGVDLSYVKQIEDYGGQYTLAGVATDPYKIFADKGANMARFRLWHTPSWIEDVYTEGVTEYSGFEEVAAGIKRAKDNGLDVNLDFHYSDMWADPGRQNPPAAWADVTDIDVLADSVYKYTYNVLSSLKNRGLLPEMVQIGNETNPGMMTTNTKATFPKLSVYDGNWTNAGKVFNAGIKAVRDIDALSGQKTKIALHVADPKNLEWWFNDIIAKAQVTDFDVAGFSYYPVEWHTTVSFADLPALVTKVKGQINKEIMILETAFPFTTEADDSYGNLFSKGITGYPVTVVGQKQFMIDLCQNMIDAGASGVMYWEPAWISSNMKDLWGTGSAWENCTFFDYEGNATAAFGYLTHEYSIRE